jgi:hypothetical protein
MPESPLVGQWASPPKPGRPVACWQHASPQDTPVLKSTPERSLGTVQGCFLRNSNADQAVFRYSTRKEQEPKREKKKNSATVNVTFPSPCSVILSYRPALRFWFDFHSLRSLVVIRCRGSREQDCLPSNSSPLSHYFVVVSVTILIAIPIQQSGYKPTPELDNRWLDWGMSSGSCSIRFAIRSLLFQLPASPGLSRCKGH